MYYSYYMNEKLALDNWCHYYECNWLLTHLLSKDDRKDIKEKTDFYFKHRHEREENWNHSKSFIKEYEDYIDKKMMYEEYLEYGEDCGMTYQPFVKNRLYEMHSITPREARLNMESKFYEMSIINSKRKLREINEVILYKSDFECIENARKKFQLSKLELDILFGLIFFSRMNDDEYCKIDSDFRRKRFKSCFEKSFKKEDVKAVETGLFECTTKDLKYLNFGNKDEVVYIFKTTIENNRLNLSLLAKEVIPDYNIKYCSKCGQEYTPTSNRQQYCPECRVEVEREQARLRKQRQRMKDKK